MPSGEAPRPTDLLALHIGGARLVAASTQPGLRLTLSGTHRRFAGPADEGDVRLTVDRADDALAAARPVFRSGGLWDLYREGEQLVFQLTSPVYGPRPYRTLRVDRRFRAGALSVHPAGAPLESPVDPFEYPLDELVMIHWLSQGRGVELHACGIVDEDGRGVIFCGQSGAGKSTTARLWQASNAAAPAVVLSDDRIIVRREQGALYMYGTPWHGEAALASATRVLCKAVLLLEQAPETRLVSLLPSAVVARLFACSFVPFHDPLAVTFALDFLTSLVGQVPCAALRLRPDGAFVPLVRALARA